MRNEVMSRISILLIITVLITFCFCFGTVDKVYADTETETETETETNTDSGSDTKPETGTDADTEQAENYVITTKAEPLGDGSFALFVSGDADADLKGVTIFRKVDGGEPETVKFKTADGKEHSMFKYSTVVAGGYIGDSDVNYNSEYQYWAAAYNIDDNNQVVDTVYSEKFAVSGVDAKATEFTNVKVTGTSKVKLYWKTISGAKGYKIYQRIDGKYTLVKKVKGESKSSTTITGLKKNKTAYFKISTYSGKTESDMSESDKGKPCDNVYTEKPSTKVKDYGKNKLSIALKKVYYNKDKELVFKALIVNRNSKRVSSFSKITIKIYNNGKLIGRQTFKEKKVNLARNKVKVMTFTFDKGTKKTGVNLRQDTEFKSSQSYRLG